MYDSLLAGGSVNLEEAREHYNISVPTFRRYIALLRDFFGEVHSKNLVYDRANNRYVLEKYKKLSKITKE